MTQWRRDGYHQYVVHHDFEGARELTTTLVHAIADVSGSDVTDVEWTVADYADPDALNRLFRPKPDGTPRANGTYTFTVWGCRVSVHSHGLIEILPLTTDAPRNGQ